MSNLLDVYKVYSLEKIAALNKQSLAMQYEQCGQLVALQNQLKAANSTSREILRNQVKELERQEKVRYSKNLIFNMNELVEKLDNIDDDAFYYYVCSVLLKPMIFLSKECLSSLEELQDKGFAKQVLKKIDSLQQKMNNLRGIYIDSCWARYEELKEKNNSIDADNKIKKLEITKRTIDEEIKRLQQELGGIFSFLISKSKKEQYNKTIDDKREQISCICEEIDALNIEKTKLSQQYNEAYQQVTISRTGWENEINEMMAFLPTQPSKRKSLDVLFEKVAKFVVQNQLCSVPMIQRKFSFGYNRSAKIVDQLEKEGIVGPANGVKPRQVLIEDLKSLEHILKDIC